MERRVQIDFIKKRFLLLEKCLNDESANEYTVSALMFHDTIFLILCLQNMIGLVSQEILVDDRLTNELYLQDDISAKEPEVATDVRRHVLGVNQKIDN
jgi:hypothetical protein